jgi:predicted Zn-dependent protease
VVWLDAGAGVEGREWSDGVLLAGTGAVGGLESFSIGVTGSPAARCPAGRPATPANPLAQLERGSFERRVASRAAVARRLIRATRGSPYAELAEGLERHVQAQRPNAPWARGAETVEIDREALALLREAGSKEPLDPFVRSLWNEMAATLADQRLVDEVFEYVEPLARLHAPWPELERVLARADLEILEPGSAADRMLRVIEHEPYDLELRKTCARALLLAERPAEAAVQLREALAIQPGREDLERMLAVALVRAGDPEGPPLLQRLLAEHPDDEVLSPYQGPGPWPPIPERFVPDEDSEGH